jgi:hypothetical protein
LQNNLSRLSLEESAAMTKDAKLGLVIGIALVIVIAVVFFRKDATIAKAASEPTAAAVKPKSSVPGTSTPVLSDVHTLPVAASEAAANPR